MRKTIIFDFDGVILDSFNPVLEILQSMHKKYGLPELTGAKLQELFENNVWESYEKIGLKGDLKKDFTSELKSQLLKRKDDFKFFNGMKDCIILLAERNDLFILTSNDSDWIKYMLMEEAIETYFVQVLGGEHPGNKEEKITKLIKDTGLNPGDIYFVTDTTGDVREVDGLGIHCVAVTWGYHSIKRLSKIKTDAVVTTPEELTAYFKA